MTVQYKFHLAGSARMAPMSRTSHSVSAAVGCVLAIAALLGAGACTPQPVEPDGQPSPVAGSSAAAPLTAMVNQFRDNYGNQIIEIQLTNNGKDTVTVQSAGVASPLFAAGIDWHGSPDGVDLPPGQGKSLPAKLTPASCSPGPAPDGSKSPGADIPLPVVTVTLVPGSAPGPAQRNVPATDPFGVLARNNSEQCLASEVRAVAGIVLGPELTVSADGERAALHLFIRPGVPKSSGTASGPAPGSPAEGAPAPGRGGAATSLVIERIETTTLLAEDPARPWPRDIMVKAGGPAVNLDLGVRPARCDPHAVAEDKVGTLVPLRVAVGDRTGLVKVAAGTALRGKIYDFVTAACAPH
ncbi:hypothetical protein SRABI83_02924 [Arthrobacter sp. Bi83]|uniref:hypothetical protein n=1 Tax=Arthrobacter sp. Bi83 TaxID=2822353 RepID=UPI001D716AE1|nr:hypothetical protein [Arthrobacter sp. Bi83]CAH0242923.1 hypothetical protein SRABI83_02924 [Arthrobacter sp. Bi83]